MKAFCCSYSFRKAGLLDFLAIDTPSRTATTSSDPRSSIRIKRVDARSACPLVVISEALPALRLVILTVDETEGGASVDVNRYLANLVVASDIVDYAKA